MKLVIGPHVHKSLQLADSSKSGFKTYAEALEAYSAFAAEHDFRMTAAQLFVSDTRKYNEPLIIEGTPEAKQLADTAHRLGITLVIHSPYINVPWGGAKGKKIAQKSIRRELSLAASLVPVKRKTSTCRGVVVHLQDHSPAQIVEDLRELVAGFGGDVPDTTLYLENEVRRSGEWAYSSTAQFKQLAEAIRAAALPLRIGVCIDTAHLWISGVDLQTPDNMRDFLRDLTAAVGDTDVMLHLNDAPTPLGQGRDSHAPLAQGYIWKHSEESLRDLLEWAQTHLPHGPIILERTGKFIHNGEKNLTWELASDFRTLTAIGVNVEDDASNHNDDSSNHNDED